MADYSLKDFEDINFYQNTIDELEDNFKSFINHAKIFNKNLEVKTKPVNEYCPIEGKEVEFPFPFAKKIKKLFYFIKGKYNSIMDIKMIISEIKQIAKSSLISHYFIQLAPNGFMMNSRVGFMIVVAEKRIKLYEGEDLAANELAFLIGVTNQGVVNKIRRGKLEAKKVGVSYQIKNEDAWELINDRMQGNYNMPVSYDYQVFLKLNSDDGIENDLTEIDEDIELEEIEKLRKRIEELEKKNKNS